MIYLGKFPLVWGVAFSFELSPVKKHRFEIPLEADIGITNVSFGVLAMMRGKFSLGQLGWEILLKRFFVVSDFSWLRDVVTEWWKSSRFS